MHTICIKWALISDGLHLIIRNQNLYALWSFYVEVFYDPKKNKMTKFRTFKSLSPLEPYLDQVELDDVL